MRNLIFLPTSVLFLLNPLLWSQSASAFPIDTDWIPIQKGGEGIADEPEEGDSNGREIVGSSEYPSAYIYFDSSANTFHTRLRLNSSPEGTGILAPYGWGLLVDTTGDFNSYEYSFMIEGSSQTLHISQNVTSDRAGDDTLCPDESCFADDEIEHQLTSASLVQNDNVRILTADSSFSNTADYFLDFSFDASVFSGTAIESEPLYFFAAVGNTFLSGDIDVAGCTNTLLLDTCAPDPMFLDGTLFFLDSDDDGLSDNDEVNIYNTEKNNPDTDDDGLNDGDEVNIYGSDPNLVDTDSDTITDYDEAIIYETNPSLADSNSDGSPDAREILCHSTSRFDSDFSSTTVSGWNLEDGDAGDAEFTAFTGIDEPGSGVLRLTDERVYESTNARFLTAMTTADGLVFEFQSHVWGGTGGDGYVFFLYDGSQDEELFTEGNYGDAIGYTNFDTGTSQISGAYLGLGFDEEGDFATTLDSNQSPLPNSIVLADGTPSYSILDYITPSFDLYDGTRTERPTLDDDGSFIHRTTLIRSTDDSGSFVSSYIRQNSTSSFQTLFSEVIQSAAIPDTVKMGFSSSTGDNTNYHEIGYIKVGRPIDLSVDLTVNWTPLPNVVALGLPENNVVVAGQELTFTAQVQNNTNTVITDSSTSISDIAIKNSTCGEVLSLEIPEHFTVVDMTCIKDSNSFCGLPYLDGNSANVIVSLFSGESATFEIVIEVQETEASTALPSSLTLLEHEGELDEHPADNYKQVDLIFMPDTDGDGLNDLEEVALGTKRDNPDSDGDGISDFVEDSTNTDPLNPDSDGDGLNDGEEDTNQNGVLDIGESDPLDADSDGDLCSDGIESIFGSDPLIVDTDEDGLNDCDEYDIGSDPLNNDSDGDGLKDGEEVNTYGSSPILSDSDEDGISDDTEVLIGANPSSIDSDEDGILDSIEGITDLDGDGIENLIDLDSDGDLIPDSIEGAQDFDGDGAINALDFDSDQDGIRDEIEVPLDPTDQDGDGIVDIFDEDPQSTDILDNTLATRFFLFATDFDGDGAIDSLDRDCDDDGVPDAWEGNTDYDGDGILDQYDIDSDADDIPDSQEGLFYQPDSDLDGVIDRIDPDNIDSDENGVTDCEQSGIFCDSDFDGIADGSEEIDTDQDGKADRVDRDSDADNIPDALEIFGTPLLQSIDIDASWNIQNTGTTAGWQLTSTGYRYADYNTITHYRGTHSGTITSSVLTIPTSDVGVSLQVSLMAHHEPSPTQDILHLTLRSADGSETFIEAEESWIHGPFTRTYRFALPPSSYEQDAEIVISFETTNSDENETSGPSIKELSFVQTPEILDSDGDEIWNHQDTDSDNDTQSDDLEDQSDSGSDNDFDQIDNNYDDNLVGQPDIDLDHIGDDIDRSILTDTDGDGIPNYIDSDSDNDGVTDQKEAEEGSNPLLEDSDEDGLNDEEEINTYNTDPTEKDTDGDGLDDNEEVSETHNTSPIDDDTDDDGITDGEEYLTYDTDPLNPDSDNDGIQDGTELGLSAQLGTDTQLNLFIVDADPSTTTDPNDADSDDDGLMDGEEDLNGNGARNTGETFANISDSDNDGIQDGTEVGVTVASTIDTDETVFNIDLDPSSTTDPLDDDSDDDGILDGDEDKNFDGAIDSAELNPNNVDSDNDGIQDGTEIGYSIPNATQTNLLVFIGDEDPTTTTNPLDTDSDEDGISDGEEDQNQNGQQEQIETAAHLIDSDNDGIQDGTEIGLTTASPNTDIAIFQPDLNDSTTTDPLDADSDEDGILDGTEDQNFDGAVDATETNPLSVDSDNDGIQDGTEIGLATPTSTATNINIFVSDSAPFNTTNPLDADSDDDGLFDGVEDSNANGRQDAGETAAHLIDSDNDGIQDGTEMGAIIPTADTDALIFIADVDFTSMTNPLDADSDDDGILDGTEDQNFDGAVDTTETNPLSADSDNDGIQDGTELGLTTASFDTNHSVFIPDANPSTTTLPIDDDSDDDGLLDGTEDQNGNGNKEEDETNPLVFDSDGDGMSDGLEKGLIEPQGSNTDLTFFEADTDPSTTTDPLNSDSDGDGIADGTEDEDRNGAQDEGETAAESSDSDNDGLSDSEELNSYNTDPNNPDSDNDGLTDAEELILNTDPNDDDSDDDGLTDGEEASTYGTDPNDSDSDNDGLTDAEELILDTDPNDSDSDNDGVIDGQEALNGTNPLDTDSDDDGFTDGEEAAQNSNPMDDQSTPKEEEAPKSGCATTTGPTESLPLLSLLALLLFRRRRTDT